MVVLRGVVSKGWRPVTLSPLNPPSPGLEPGTSRMVVEEKWVVFWEMW